MTYKGEFIVAISLACIVGTGVVVRNAYYSSATDNIESSSSLSSYLNWAGNARRPRPKGSRDESNMNSNHDFSVDADHVLEDKVRKTEDYGCHDS